MRITIEIAVFLLLPAACIAFAVFIVKKRGWLFAFRFGSLGLLVGALISSSEQTRVKFGVPLLAATVIAWLWPHIVKGGLSARSGERGNDDRSIE